jgi:hypothetical protein
MPKPVEELFPEHRTIADDLAIDDFRRELTEGDLQGFAFVSRDVAERAFVALARGKTTGRLAGADSALDIFEGEAEAKEGSVRVTDEDAQTVLKALLSVRSVMKLVPGQTSLLEKVEEAVTILEEEYDVVVTPENSPS